MELKIISKIFRIINIAIKPVTNIEGQYSELGSFRHWCHLALIETGIVSSCIFYYLVG